MHYFWQIISILATLAVKSEAAQDVLEPFPAAHESPVSGGSNGPITTAMENLAYNTASVADEMSLQVNSKLERTADIIHGGIEMLIANALEQLSQPIYQATRKLSKESCNATFSLADLQSNVDLRLSLCTEEPNALMQKFKSDADSSVAAIENFITKIINLPKACQVVGESSGEDKRQTFAESTRCFVEGITALNEQFSNELNTVGLLLSRTQELSQQSETQALICIEAFVNEVVKVVDKQLKDC